MKITKSNSSRVRKIENIKDNLVVKLDYRLVRLTLKCYGQLRYSRHFIIQINAQSGDDRSKKITPAFKQGLSRLVILINVQSHGLRLPVQRGLRF